MSGMRACWHRKAYTAHSENATQTRHAFQGQLGVALATIYVYYWSESKQKREAHMSVNERPLDKSLKYYYCNML